ncbi:MAG: hypothetical protein AB7E32_05615 [Desulfovibrio sp.]
MPALTMPVHPLLPPRMLKTLALSLALLALLELSALPLPGFALGVSTALAGPAQPTATTGPNAPNTNAPDKDVPENVRQLAAFMADDLYQELVLSQWQRQSMELCGEPAEPGVLRHAGLSIYEDVRFRGGKPFSGVWADRYRGQACGRERQFNFLFNTQDGKVMIRHMLPGRTEAPPRLQIDAMKTALPKLRERHPQCETFIPVDSEIEHAPKHVNDPWSEIWVFDACGKLAASRVTFTPDGQGGTYFQVE